jgi:hypothetical protein
MQRLRSSENGQTAQQEGQAEAPKRGREPPGVGERRGKDARQTAAPDGATGKTRWTARCPPRQLDRLPMQGRLVPVEGAFQKA